jgi:hypothetical protein
MKKTSFFVVTVISKPDADVQTKDTVEQVLEFIKPYLEKGITVAIQRIDVEIDPDSVDYLKEKFNGLSA